jgi:hypothetical protein
VADLMDHSRSIRANDFIEGDLIGVSVIHRVFEFFDSCFKLQLVWKIQMQKWDGMKSRNMWRFGRCTVRQSF